MSRSKAYQKLLNSRRWRELRALKMRSVDGLCERCREEGIAAGIPGGYITPAVDVHHIVPVETGRTQAEMEHLCYCDLSGLRALCIKCHSKTHDELRSRSREAHQERADQELQRWKEKNTPKP